jgi:CSLREA domain-containing protein
MFTKHSKTLFRLSIPVCMLLSMLPVLTVRSAPAVPAAIIAVTTQADEFGTGLSTGCSLREAIQSANTDTAFGGCAAGFGADVITLPAGYYTLTGAAGENSNASGDLDITSDVTINKVGVAVTVIQAGTTVFNGVDRVLHIHSGATVEINDVTIRFGRAPNGVDGATGTSGEGGGGILNYKGSLTLNRCDVRDNRAGAGGDSSASNGGYGGNGGGIHNYEGTLSLNDTAVTNNASGPGGDGGPGREGGWGGYGGGIYSQVSVVTLINATVSGNASGAGGDGGDAVNGDAGDGSNGGPGGGVSTTTAASLTIIDSTIAANSTGAGGDGGDVTGGNGDGGDGGDGGSGAGIHTLIAVALTVTHSTISDNATGLGGSGGAGSGTGSSGSNGARGYGGGLVTDSQATLSASTFSGNTAYHGGGILGAGTATLTFVTITDNTTFGDGGGVYAIGSFTMANTIVAGNTDMGGENPDCRGTVTSGDYNLLGIGNSADCTFMSQANDLVGTTASPIDPRLGDLGDNGGPTWTHSLNLGSPAIDRIPMGVNGCSAGNDDQRGEPRLPPCDIGAYEANLEYVYLPLVLKDY